MPEKVTFTVASENYYLKKVQSSHFVLKRMHIKYRSKAITNNCKILHSNLEPKRGMKTHDLFVVCSKI